MNVVDNSIEIIASETFDSNPFEDTTKWTTKNVTVAGGAVSLPNNANATAYTMEYFMDGYVEASIAFDDVNITEGKTIYAPTLICRQASDGEGEIRTRFAIKNTDGIYTAQLQTMVFSNKNYPTEGFATSSTIYYGTDELIDEIQDIDLLCIEDEKKREEA